MIRSFYNSVKHSYKDLMQTLQTIDDPFPATRDCVSLKVARLGNDIWWYRHSGGKRSLKKEIPLCVIGKMMIDSFPEN